MVNKTQNKHAIQTLDSYKGNICNPYCECKYFFKSFLSTYTAPLTIFDGLIDAPNFKKTLECSFKENKYFRALDIKNRTTVRGSKTLEPFFDVEENCRIAPTAPKTGPNTQQLGIMLLSKFYFKIYAYMSKI